jgi:uncharacterized spore protein YtfJ
MAENKVSEIMKDIVGELKSIARSQTVVGEPITVEKKTVIPVVKISLGFGAGGGQGEHEGKAGFGGGGGGAARIEPSAFIIMDEKKISLLSAKPGRLDALVDAVPALFGKVKELKDSLKKDKEEADKDKTDDSSDDDKPEGGSFGSHPGW